MIQGFEKETAPLTDYERDVLLPVLVRGLACKVGRNMSVSNRHIVSGLNRLGYKVDEPRVRKLINHIRLNGLVPCLIATSSGYYVATDREEIKAYIDSLIGREQAIRAVREAMEEQERSRYLMPKELELFDTINYQSNQ